MIGLIGCAGSTAVVGWIPCLLLWLVVRMQTQCLAAWFGGKDADPMLLGEVTDSSPMGYEPKSIIVEVEGAETQTLLEYTGYHRPPEGVPVEARTLLASNLSLTLNIALGQSSAVTLTFGCCLYVYIALGATLLFEGSISVHRKSPNKIQVTMRHLTIP